MTSFMRRLAAGYFLTAAFSKSGMQTVGIPLLISGGIRKANNRKAMEEIERNQGLTLGFNPYGFGVAWKF